MLSDRMENTRAPKEFRYATISRLLASGFRPMLR